jgi:hypothetical protein
MAYISTGHVIRAKESELGITLFDKMMQALATFNRSHEARLGWFADRIYFGRRGR